MNNQFEIDCDDDFIIISVAMYKFFMANGKEGLDAKQLYEHLLFTARLQNSKKIHANLSYIKNGLGWGNAKVKNARRFLSAAGLIEFDQVTGSSGQFGGKNIIIKKSWDSESLRAWIEKKSLIVDEEITGGSEIEPTVIETDDTGGSITEPMEDMGCSESEDAIYPEVQLSGGPLTGRPVSEHKYKGSYKKENSPHKEEAPPEASSPPTVSFSSFLELKTHMILMVKKQDQESLFFFTDIEVKKLESCFKRYGPDWILDRFKNYLKSKTISQINRFHATDFPKVLQRAIEKSAPQKPLADPMKTDFHKCPVCGRTWTASSTLSCCSTCGFELKDFNDQHEIDSHLVWFEEFQKNRKRSAVG